MLGLGVLDGFRVWGLAGSEYNCRHMASERQALNPEIPKNRNPAGQAFNTGP